MKRITFDRYCDPNHSWFKVDKQWISTHFGPNWRKHFSVFSYETDKAVFLEEDQDWYVFQSFVCDHYGLDIRIREHHTDRLSRIRRYQPLAAI